MKKVLTVGVFDYFHYGHLRLFQRAKALGDYLIVAVQDGDFILRFKSEATVCYTTEQRLEMVGALKVVVAVAGAPLFCANSTVMFVTPVVFCNVKVVPCVGYDTPSTITSATM